jgi:hypothetical protein
MRKFHRHVRKVVIITKDNELAEVVREKAAILLDSYRDVN